AGGGWGCCEPGRGGRGWGGGGEGWGGGRDAGYRPVVRGISPRGSRADDYASRAEHAHQRAKYCLPAPSYHRRFWYPQHSADAYPSCEAFMEAIRDYLRGELARRTRLGRHSAPLDAPNYGTPRDVEHRRRLESRCQ